MPGPSYRTTSPPTGKPLLLWDGDCGFCRLWATRWEEAYGDRVDLATAQSQAVRFPEIPAVAYGTGIQLVDTDGAVYSGVAAALRTRRIGRDRPDVFHWSYQNIPGVARGLEAAYGVVARHRPVFARLTRWLHGPDLRRPGYAVAADVFLRVLAVVYFSAFLSFWWQLNGLVGPGGILPAQAWLDAVAQQTPGAWWRLPTLCWIFGAGIFLHLLCGGGLLLSALLFLRRAQAPCLLLLWLGYLSLCGAGQVFLGYQWDNLLLETGLLAVLLAPWRVRPGPRAEPPASARWLLGWLLLRLMFLSAWVKLTSGDPTWSGLTALTYHYQTQPLPTWLAWHAHHLPLWFQQASCLGMFIIEFVAPFLLFGPRRLRLAAVASLVALQTAIALTGNYTFFNLLTIALCLLRLDDRAWAQLFRFHPAPTAARAAVPAWRQHSRQLMFSALLAASVLVTLPALFRGWSWPDWYGAAYQAVSAIRSVNSYGLFAVMTTRRPEIIIEGSRDGRTWAAYEFKWKPGDLRRRPGFVAPYQPRLDWQLWFAALAYPRYEAWINPFFRQLAANAPAVTGLLAHNPFAAEAPHYLRAVLYEYEFTTPEERARTGEWWKRTSPAYYLPPTRVR